MAVVRFGDTGPILGLVAETVGFAQDFSIKQLYEEVMVDNNIGETVTYGLFNKKWEGQIVLIDKQGASLPVAASEVAFTNLNVATYGDPTQVIIIDHERKPEQKGAQKNTYNFKAFINIS
jgi:hypothetical protein